MAHIDVIVIGAGHNGLTAAALLARAGRQTLVLEHRDAVGGLAASDEFHRGYHTAGILHDTGALRTGLIKALRLEEHGLQTTGCRAPLRLLFEDGAAITLSSDLRATQESIAGVSARDAQAYGRYRAFCDALAPWLGRVFGSPLPPIVRPRPHDALRLFGHAAGLRRLGRRVMQEFMRIAPMSVADFLDEYFETDALRAALAVPVLERTFGGPLSPFGAVQLLLWEATSQEHVIGGPAALVRALRASAAAHGATMRTSATVRRILVDASGACGVELSGGEQIAARVIAASCSPKEVFLRLLRSRDLGPHVVWEAQGIRCRGTTAHIALALQRTPRREAPAHTRLAGAVHAMERAFDAVKNSRLPEAQALDIYVPGPQDPSLAPPEHEVVSVLAHQTPYAVAGGWTSGARERLTGRVLRQIEPLMPGIADALVASRVWSPQDLETQFRLEGGHLFHAEHAVDQLLGRPIPSCRGYATPITGLFLCGSGAHPGGGVTCAPGALAAREVLSRS